MLRESKIGNWYLKWIEEIPVPFLSRLSFKPNHLTLSAFIISLSTVPAFLYSLWLGGLGILLSGACDTLDGSLARESNQKTKAGAFLDSVLDRYGDFLFLFGIWLYFLTHRESQLMLLTAVLFFSFLGFFMVSYTRARGEGLGLSMTEGMFGRAERLLSLGLGCILNDILIVFFPKPNWLGEHFFIISLLTLLTLGTHWTAFQRIRYLTKNL